jgi:hypothetical protein
MSKKLTYEYVKKYFEENGCKMLDTKYRDARTKIKYECSCGGISEILFHGFKAGYRCKECVKVKKRKKFAFTYKYVKSFFKKHGCKMLDDFYVNAREKINYRCLCGNFSKISFSSFKNGNRCRKCGSKRMGIGRRYKYKYVKGFFKNHGCELLEKEYKNNRTKMKYKCSCGNICKISFYNFKNGSRCMKCRVEKNSGENNYKWIQDRKSYKEKQMFKQKCYKMLRNSLKSTRQSKNSRTHIMLGYYPEDLKKHIYNHSNWKNIKDKKWHLDHIFPIQAFVDYGVKDIKLINCLDNLQPLERKENISKSDNYDKEEFRIWLKKKAGVKK